MTVRLVNYIISYALVGTILAYLAFFIYFKDRKNPLFRIFALYNLSIAWWCLFSIPAIISRDHAIGVVWCRIFIAGVIFTPTLVLHCAYLLLDYLKNRKYIQILAYSYAVSVFFFILDFSPLFIAAAERKQTLLSYTVPGPFFHLHVLHFFCIMLYGETLYFMRYLKIKDTKRSESKKYLYYFLSSVIATLGGGANYLPPYGLEIPILNPFGSYTIILYAFVVAYTIVRYRFLNTSVFVSRTGIFIAVYTFVIGSPFLLATFGKHWLMHLFGDNWWFGPLVLLGILASAGPFLYIYFQKRAEEFFLREQRLYQETLREAAAGMTRIRNVRNLLEMLIETITKNVRMSHAAVFLFDADSDRYIRRAGKNLSPTYPETIEANGNLVQWLQNHREPLLYEPTGQQNEETLTAFSADIIEQLDYLEASLVAASLLEDKTLALIVLGQKTSGKSYTADDAHIFSILASEAGLAIENASLYENIEAQVKQRTQELVQTQKQLVQAEKLATMGTLAGGVAHEINNPLTAILTNAQILLETGQYDKESLEMIEEATKRCRTIVQKLMAYAKKPVEATMIYDIDLKEVITNAVSFLKFQLEQENITVHLNAADSVYPVKGNHNELEQVVTNLMLNAKDSIRKIKHGGRIDLNVSKDADWIMLAVKDEGAGIPPHIMGRIFDPFFTTKDVGKGLGLGLSICQSIIDKHKGRITVESKENAGATFTVYLPRVKGKQNSGIVV